MAEREWGRDRGQEFVDFLRQVIYNGVVGNFYQKGK